MFVPGWGGLRGCPRAGVSVTGRCAGVGLRVRVCQSPARVFLSAGVVCACPVVCPCVVSVQGCACAGVCWHDGCISCLCPVVCVKSHVQSLIRVQLFMSSLMSSCCSVCGCLCQVPCLVVGPCAAVCLSHGCLSVHGCASIVCARLCVRVGVLWVFCVRLCLSSALVHTCEGCLCLVVHPCVLAGAVCSCLVVCRVPVRLCLCLSSVRV